MQNLLVFRFANLLFESSWHRDRIAAVQVTVAEDGGVGTRGRYYDKSGAVRDILQNHLTQLLALIRCRRRQGRGWRVRVVGG